MKGIKGYYSLIQFCPDLSRLETVNVGVLLFCPEPHFLDCRISKSNRRARRLFDKEPPSARTLNAAKQAITHRLKNDKASFVAREDLERFVDSLGNNLILTRPRSIKVFDPEIDLGNLFIELVGDESPKASQGPVFPKLDAIFHELKAQGRAELNVTVEIPIVELALQVPYVYRNGVTNLVKPHRFSTDETDAIRAAMRIAVQGDLIKRHTKEDGKSQELIIVSAFERTSAAGRIEDRVRQVLAEYEVKTIGESEIDTFAAKVRRDAHK